MSLSARRTVADTSTGETILVEREKQRAAYGYAKDSEGKRFMTLGAAAIEEIEKNDHYHLATLRVLLHLVRVTGEDGVVTRSQADIVRTTGVSRSGVSRAFKQLAADKYVYYKGRVPYLNPRLGHTGTGAQHQQAIARMPEHLREDATVTRLHSVS